jgi:hypothetical protein
MDKNSVVGAQGVPQAATSNDLTDRCGRNAIIEAKREISTLPAPSAPGWSKELVQAIAMDIGKEVAAYIEVMYPKAVEATSSTFLLSVRNSIYNEIMAAIEVNDAGQITARIKDRKKFRREWKAAWKKIRAHPPQQAD